MVEGWPLLGWLALDSVDITLILVAGFVGVTSLVRMMRVRRDAILDDLQQQIEREQSRRKAKRRRQEQRQFREELRRKREKDAA